MDDRPWPLPCRSPTGSARSRSATRTAPSPARPRPVVGHRRRRRSRRPSGRLPATRRTPKGRSLRRPRPEVTYPEALPIAERRDEVLAAIRDNQVVVVAGETGSGKSTQLPKMCLELGRGVRGLIGHTQPRRLAARTVAGPRRRGAGHRARRPRRLHGALHRPGGRPHARQAHDRRHPAGRAPARPPAAPLRHAHRRRGPRAQPQHRLPARLPHRPAAPPARPQGHRHLGHHRHRALRRALRRPGGRGVGAHATRSRCATGRSARRRAGDGPPARRPPRPTRSTASAAAVDELRARGAGRHPRVPQRRARDPRHAPPPSTTPACAGTEILPALRPPVGRRAAAGVPAPPGPAHRARHQRGRDVDHRARRPLRRRPRHRPHLPLQPPHQGAAPAHRAGQPGVGRPAGGALRAGGARHLHPPLRPRRTSTPGPSSPSPRSCAPTWRRSSCRWRRWGSATSSRSPSSTRPTPAPSATGSPCWSSWARMRRPDRTLTPLGRRLARLPDRPAVRAHDPRGRRAGLRAARC